MKKVSFKKWFQDNGTDLLKGWLRAREDGNEEEFEDWVTAEYDTYKEDGDEYDIPYHGLCDGPAKSEKVIYGPIEYDIRMTVTPGSYAVIEKEHEKEVLHTGPLVDCEKWIMAKQIINVNVFHSGKSRL